MARLQRIVSRLPEAERVDIEAWGGEPYRLVAPRSLAKVVLAEDGIDEP